MGRSQTITALDVGEKRIGVAQADTAIQIAVPFTTVEVDGDEIVAITQIIDQSDTKTLVVGYPRNQSGDATAQTAAVEAFTDKLRHLDIEIVFQDESLTSVLAEERLKMTKKPYDKGDVDAMAASIILSDYLETHRG